MLDNEYIGSTFRVVHCKGAIDSLDIAIESVQAGKKRKSFIRGLIMQIKALANGKRMSKENFPSEGFLPKLKGQANAKRFKAFKRIPIRGYCWRSETHENTYFISHYVHKNYNKLKDADTNKVGNNWCRIEEKGDEC